MAKPIQYCKVIYLQLKKIILKNKIKLCLYYLVEIKNIDDFSDNVFTGTEEMSGDNFQIEFHWIPLVQLKDIKIYPEKATELMMRLDSGVQHFIYKEI